MMHSNTHTRTHTPQLKRGELYAILAHIDHCVRAIIVFALFRIDIITRKNFASRKKNNNY